MTVCDAGLWASGGQPKCSAATSTPITLLRKVAMEIFVNDDFLDRTLNASINPARTGPEGTIGDGKIFVLPAEQAIQMNDGIRGPGAVNVRHPRCLGSGEGRTVV